MHGRLRRDLRSAQAMAVCRRMGQRRLKETLAVLPRSMSDLLARHTGRDSPDTAAVDRGSDLLSVFCLKIADILRGSWSACCGWPR
jgi:hypothetical protein